MAGIDVGGGGGGRRKTDSEINMVPFIDLLMVTISFLLITAVWTHMARLQADAQVPGPPQKKEEQEKTDPEPILHVDMQARDKFVLTWKQGTTVLKTIDIPRKENITDQGGTQVVHYAELAKSVQAEWTLRGQHRDPTDQKLDQAVLHTNNETPYVQIIGALDAIYQAKRPYRAGKEQESVPAFNVTFSMK